MPPSQAVAFPYLAFEETEYKFKFSINRVPLKCGCSYVSRKSVKLHSHKMADRTGTKVETKSKGENKSLYPPKFPGIT